MRLWLVLYWSMVFRIHGAQYDTLVNTSNASSVTSLMSPHLLPGSPPWPYDTRPITVPTMPATSHPSDMTVLEVLFHPQSTQPAYAASAKVALGYRREATSDPFHGAGTVTVMGPPLSPMHVPAR